MLEKNILVSVFDELPMAIFVVDNDVRVQFLNTEASKLISQGKEIYNQRGGELLNCIYSRITTAGCGCSESCKDCDLRNSVYAAIDGKKTYRASTVLSLNLNDNIIQYHAVVTTSPFTYNDRQLVLLVVEDENTLVEINNELVQAVEELKQMHYSKDSIMRIVSHDLKNLIGSASQIIELLRFQEMPEKALKYIDTIEMSTQKAIKLVSDILNANEIESEGFKLDLHPHLIDEYLKGLMCLFTAACEPKKIHFIADLAAENVKVNIQPDKMWQILNNLVHNAIKFTKSGGSVSLKTEIVDNAPTAEAGEGREGASASFVLIKVIDNGIGIPADNIPVLFDKFTKAKRKGTDGESTTGIGLSIVKRLVELHHGEISVTSEVDKGTEFTIKLPMA